MKITLRFWSEEGQNIRELLILPKGGYPYQLHPSFNEVETGNCLFTVKERSEKRCVIPFSDQRLEKLLNIINTLKLPLSKDSDIRGNPEGFSVVAELSFETINRLAGKDKVCFSWRGWDRFDPPKEWEYLEEIVQIILELEKRYFTNH